MITIVMGLPGSGKSYFASRLAERLGAVHVNSDRVRKDRNALGKYALKDKFAVYGEMAKITEKYISENKSVVVDATFYLHAMRDLFHSLAERLSVPVYWINVEADEALIKERLSRPRQDSEADFGVYEQIKEELEEIKLPHLNLRSTQNNITQMLEKAIKYTGDLHEGKGD